MRLPEQKHFISARVSVARSVFNDWRNGPEALKADLVQKISYGLAKEITEGFFTVTEEPYVTTFRVEGVFLPINEYHQIIEREAIRLGILKNRAEEEDGD